MDPSKENPIVIEPNRNRVRILFNGRVIADTTRAEGRSKLRLMTPCMEVR